MVKIINMKMEEKDENKLSPGQCNKDSDCSTGEVCVNGKCVPDIGAIKSEDEAFD